MQPGNNRVGVGFNPSGNDHVGQVKAQFAVLIDEMQSFIGRDYGPEKERCAEIAQVKMEEACMWAVKTITKPDGE